MQTIQKYLFEHNFATDIKISIDDLIVYQDSIAIWLKKYGETEQTTASVLIGDLELGNYTEFSFSDGQLSRQIHLFNIETRTFNKIVERAKEKGINVRCGS